MSRFDRVLEDCLDSIASGASTLDECLAHYPEQAARLRPLLQAAVRVGVGQNVRPSPAFKARTRARLYGHMQTHPRHRRWTFSPAWRVAVGLAVLVAAFFVSGTAFAQGALPGQPLYAWKLYSEQVWRAVAPEPVAVDLSLADRRIAELVAVAPDPTRQARALDGYLEVLARLKSESDVQNSERIIQTLKSHQERLSTAGISIPELDVYLSSSGENPAIVSPESVPTVLPPLVPDIVPTVPPPLVPDIVPTLIPSLLP